MQIINAQQGGQAQGRAPAACPSQGGRWAEAGDREGGCIAGWSAAALLLQRQMGGRVRTHRTSLGLSPPMPSPPTCSQVQQSTSECQRPLQRSSQSGGLLAPLGVQAGQIGRLQPHCNAATPSSGPSGPCSCRSGSSSLLLLLLLEACPLEPTLWHACCSGPKLDNSWWARHVQDSHPPRSTTSCCCRTGPRTGAGL
jgi:hypothetical protein